MNRRCRPAFTLIEMLVVMTAGLTVLMLAIGMIERTMKVAASHQANLDQCLVTQRLIRQFRSDSYQASNVRFDGAVEFTLPDRTLVVYRVSNHQVVRTERLDDTPVRNEVYELGENRRADIDVSGESNIAQLSIRSETMVGFRTDRRVETTVGRWLLFDSLGQESP